METILLIIALTGWSATIALWIYQQRKALELLRLSRDVMKRGEAIVDKQNIIIQSMEADIQTKETLIKRLLKTNEKQSNY